MKKKSFNISSVRMVELIFFIGEFYLAQLFLFVDFFLQNWNILFFQFLCMHLDIHNCVVAIVKADYIV